MPSNDDDTAAHGGGGPLSYWLKYKVWGVPGYLLVALVLFIGLAVGHSV